MSEQASVPSFPQATKLVVTDDRSFQRCPTHAITIQRALQAYLKPANIFDIIPGEHPVIPCEKCKDDYYSQLRRARFCQTYGVGTTFTDRSQAEGAGSSSAAAHDGDSQDSASS